MPSPWPRSLARFADGPIERIGGGVEGVVYRLRPGTVAKVWTAKPAAELELMRQAYSDLDAAGLPVGTPVFEQVLILDGSTVTIERELPGRPLQDLLHSTDAQLPVAAVDAVLDCLIALRSAPAAGALYRLPVVGEDRPFRTPGDCFTSALIALLERRVAACRPALTAALPDFDRRFDALRSRLDSIDEQPDSIVHGDLFGANIHVDPAGRAVAVLDFGFMTTAGDARFDAGVSAGIMNMYGPNAAAITDQLTVAFAGRLGYDPTVLLSYRAAYAVATSTLFGTDLSDGHFRWCVEQLRDPNLVAALER